MALTLVGVTAVGVTAWLSNANKHAVVVTGLVAAAVAAAAVVPLQQLLGGARQRRAVLARRAAGATVGRLPLLEEISLDRLGVRAPREASGLPRRQPPYASRHSLDPALEAALSRHRFVLVHGPSATGKSRSTAETARRLWPRWRVLVPYQQQGGLAELVDAGIAVGTVVWLDDLDRHMDAGVDAGLIRRLLDLEDVKVVATMRAAAYEAIKPGRLRAAGSEVVGLAHLERFTEWDEEDRDRASTMLISEPDQADVVAALRRGMGLGGYLAAVPDLIERLEEGTPPPEGVAVVRITADWYRSGLTRPAPLPWARALYPEYLPADDISLLARFDDGIAWATSPVSGARLLRQPTDGSGLAIHDSVLEYLSATWPPGLPGPTWQALIAELTASQSFDELTTVGITAYRVHNNPNIAEHLLNSAAGAGQADAANNLGVLLERSGRAEEAEQWYRTAAGAGQADAANNLGVLLERSGRAEEAEQWYRTAAGAGQADAANNLGVLLERSGRAEEAEQWYRTAAGAGHADAANNLGVLLERSGRAEEAEQWYRTAAGAGQADAANNLGVLLERSGRAEEAEQWYRTAAGAGQADAANNLGVLLERSGRAEEAEQWYRTAAGAGHADAANNLGVLLERSGRAEEAEQWYRTAAGAGHADAANNLGVLLERSGRAPEIVLYAARLAGLVRAQWEAEVLVRRLFDPYPLPVSWVPADLSPTIPWTVLVKLATRGGIQPALPSWASGPEELKGADNQIADVLARVPTRRLVVLGGPGSGKTTLMVRLMLELLANRAEKAPVPVLLPAASWDPSRDNLGTWIVRRLYANYPVLSGAAGSSAPGKTRAQALVAGGLILPLLDGLDEMPAEARSQAILHINDWLWPGAPLVVTCRTEVYREMTRTSAGFDVRLVGAAAIELRPLDPRVVSTYQKESAGGPAAATRWEPVIAALRRGGPLAEALSNPLMVSLARSIYTPRPGEDVETSPDPTELLAFADRKAIENHLVNASVVAAYHPAPTRRSDGGSWSTQQALNWLRFLARHMEQMGTVDIAWWRLSDVAPRWLFPFTFSVFAGAASGLAAGLVAGLAIGTLAGLSAGLAVGLWSWAVTGKHRSPAGRVRYRRRALLFGLGTGFASGLSIGLAAGAENGFTTGLSTWIAVTYAVGLRGAPSHGPASVTPVTALRRDRITALLLVILSGCPIGFVTGLACWQAFGPRIGVAAGLAAGIAAGLSVCASESASPQWVISRLWLALRRRLPWRLMRFLEEAHEIGLLRRMGATYQFRHIALQQLLAGKGSSRERDWGEQDR